MKLRSTVWVGLLMAAGVCSGKEAGPAADVEVYVANDAGVPMLIQSVAVKKAAQIFADAGIAVRFRNTPGKAAGQALRVHFVHHPSYAAPVTALAYAFPYEGTRIDVIYDRVVRESPRMTAAVLAYVLVHEITHILKGTTSHSAEGVMKARWDADDNADLLMGRMRLTADDVSSIRAGLAVRAQGSGSGGRGQ